MRAANACAPASTARQSLPVAMTTASMPFMMPLLCVAARYGSSSAKRDALTMPSMTSSPSISSVASDARPARGSARARSACRRGSTGCAGRRVPPAIAATRSATASATVLTRFAPIASWQSTRTCTTTMSSAEHARLDAARAAAARDEARRPRGRRARGSPRACAAMRSRRRARRRVTSRSCDLRDHERRVDLGDEAAAGAHHLRGVRRRRDDARLLDDHRHDVVVAVDAHVERDAVGQRVRAEDVLDELVGRLGVEPARLERALDVARVARRSRRRRARGAPATVTL